MSTNVLRQAAEQIRADCPIPDTARGHDFIDYPTGWALQRAGLAHVDERCSAAQTGGALLCDCGALYPAWRCWRALLSVADLLDERSTSFETWQRAGRGEPRIIPAEFSPAFAVAESYLLNSPASAGSAGSTA